MNVDQIYRFHRDGAFAKQFTATSYTTFVAMPFARTDDYDADDIYRCLKEKVYLRANDLGQDLPRQFAPLERASEHKGTALVVTDLITTRILEDHFFVGDLTANNAGAILENGYCPCSQTESPAGAHHARPPRRSALRPQSQLTSRATSLRL